MSDKIEFTVFSVEMTEDLRKTLVIELEGLSTHLDAMQAMRLCSWFNSHHNVLSLFARTLKEAKKKKKESSNDE